MEELRSIEKCLISQIQAQCNDLKKVNAKELGEVVDMVKDLEEAIYYCSITKAMEKSAEEKEHNMNVNYYMEGNMGRMYYDDQARNSNGTYASSSNNKYYVPYMEYAPYMMHDDKWRDNHYPTTRSDTSRRMYMEGKAQHKNDVESMQDLEHYMKDLTDDMVEMIKSSTPEEK